jgi:hypothetical protein
VKHKSGRKHWKSEFSEGFKKGFKEKEWDKIENFLNSQDTPSNPSSSEQQAQQEQPPKEIKYMGYYYHRGNKC